MVDEDAVEKCKVAKCVECLDCHTEQFRWQTLEAQDAGFGQAPLIDEVLDFFGVGRCPVAT